MTVNIANTSNNNTFDYWRNRTNETAYAFSVYAVTANGSNAAVGNAAITGKFTANTLYINTVAHVNNNLIVGNNTIDEYSFTYVNSSAISVGNSISNSYLDYNSLNTFAVYVGSNVVVNTNHFYITDSTGGQTSNLLANSSTLLLRANTSVNSTINSTVLVFTNGVYSSALDYDSLSIGDSLVNSIAISMVGSNSLYANTEAVTVGANLVMNTSSIRIGNSTINSFSNSSLLSISNSSGTANLSATNLTIGNSVVNSTVVIADAGSFVNVITIGSIHTITPNSTSLTYNTNTQFDGVYANVGGDLYVQGDLIITGNLTYTGVSTADMLPAETELYDLGKFDLKWRSLWVVSANISQNVTIGGNVAISQNTTMSRFLSVGNSLTVANTLTVGGTATVNSTGINTLRVNATSYNIGTSFTANSSGVNTAYLSVQTGSNGTYLDAHSITISNATTSIVLDIPSDAAIANGQYYLNANGSWSIVSTGLTTNGAYTTSGTLTHEIDSYNMVSYPAAEYIISVVDNVANNRYMSKILTTHDRGTGYMTEFASITTNTNVGTFSFVAPNVSHVALRFTPVSTATTVKFVRTIVT